MKKLHYILILILVLVGSSCNDLLEFGPSNDGVVLAENALETPDDLPRLLNSCYDVFANTFDGDVQFINELLSDNLAGVNPNNQNIIDIYNREAGDFNGLTNGVYNDFYFSIFRSNAIIDNFDLVEGLSESERTRMEAEARFIRAVSHWELVKLYGQPYGYTPGNTHLGIILRLEPTQESKNRSTVAEVYNAVIEDLNFAKDNLPAVNDVYATTYSASSYLAKVHLQMGEYQTAASYAQDVIDGPFQLDSLGARYAQFTISNETVFGFTSAILDDGSTSGNIVADNRVGAYINAYSGTSPNAEIAGSEYSSMFNGSADLREGIYYTAPSEVLGNALVSKYDKQFFSHAVTSLTEMLLLQAEAYAITETNLTQAIENVNLVRERAFGNDVFNLEPNATAAQILEAARLEKRKEFISEGKRVDDLKRRGVAGEEIIVRGAPWDCNGMVVQFPLGEIVVPDFQDNPVGGCN